MQRGAANFIRRVFWAGRQRKKVDVGGGDTPGSLEFFEFCGGHKAKKTLVVDHGVVVDVGGSAVQIQKNIFF